MKPAFQIVPSFLCLFQAETTAAVWRKRLLPLFLLLSGFSLLQGESPALPEWVHASSGDIETARVLAIEELSEADLVIFSGGYETGYRPGMVGAIQRHGNSYAEVLIVEVRPKVMAAVIRELEEGHSIQSGDLLRPSINRF
ncbi:MAG: hypothetical protein JJT75_09485 [Opitutales bacterium]|nr:hypothetical protein [Opitutales bacterium]MCH8539892.1 hypothetical protein [Opitutales bacterium]